MSRKYYIHLSNKCSLWENGGLNSKAVTKIQAVILATIIVVAAVAGAVYVFWIGKEALPYAYSEMSAMENAFSWTM